MAGVSKKRGLESYTDARGRTHKLKCRCVFCRFRRFHDPVAPTLGRGRLPNGQFPLETSGHEPWDWNGPFERYLTRNERPRRDVAGDIMRDADGIPYTERIEPAIEHDEVLAILRRRHPAWAEVFEARLQGEPYEDIAVRLSISYQNARYRKSRADKEAQRIIWHLTEENDALRLRQRVKSAHEEEGEFLADSSQKMEDALDSHKIA